jgi:hypothetical protein
MPEDNKDMDYTTKQMEMLAIRSGHSKTKHVEYDGEEGIVCATSRTPDWAVHKRSMEEVNIVRRRAVAARLHAKLGARKAAGQ